MGSDSSPDAGLLKSLLSIISSVKGDLANVAIPPYFLAAKSVTQVPASWSERPSTFAAPAKEPDAQKRALLVLKLFLTSLRTQFYVNGDVEGGIKKPLNAFLGEIFSAKYSEGDDTTEILSEQVSHHPPITATHVWDEQSGIHVNGYARVEMTFNGNVNIKQYGHIMLHIDAYNEDYLVPFPDAQVKGIMSGKFYPELIGTYQIVSSSGFVSEIDFSGKSFLGSGDKNQLHATIYRNEDTSKKPLYSADGCWSGTFTIRDETSGHGDIETIDTAVPPSEPIYVSDPDPWETQVAWADVLLALRKRDPRSAGAAKRKLEDAQRAQRKARPQQDWRPLFFVAKDDWYPTFDKLAQDTGLNLQKERTKGVWVFARERFKEMERPWRGELRPGSMPMP